MHHRRNCQLLCLVLTLGVVFSARVRGIAAELTSFRPPAVPLVTHDPYFSVWSMNDHLTDGWSKHWTGTNQTLSALIRIDGKPYRLMGPEPAIVPALKQVRLEVLPTRTIYQFEGQGVHVTWTFTSPLLPTNLDVLSRPVTYFTVSVHSTDGQAHAVSCYFDSAAELTVNTPEQKVTWGRFVLEGLDVLRASALEQPVLQKSGDNLRIDWGYLYLALPRRPDHHTFLCDREGAVRQFVERGEIPVSDDLRMPRSASDETPVLACLIDFKKIQSTPTSRHWLLAYDDLYSIEYFHRKLRPYWRRNGLEAGGMLREAEADYAGLLEACVRFDTEFIEDLVSVGGDSYAQIAALAYRQCLAAHKLVADIDGKPFLFPKENFSNGCIATVDVQYPSSPMFLLLNPKLLRALIVPILEYAQLPRWRFPFAPHDLGTYPLANGQVYGGGERTEENQMPVEESGNMLLMVTALAQVEGDTGFALQYWPVLSRWADYLREKGMDPENQLCTDDFAGHLAHNANLSLKAILALGGYARLCEMAGKAPEAAKYRNIATEMVPHWIQLANDGDHFRLAFDKPGTWSQKYNLVWDRLLGLNLFPPAVAAQEVAFYKTKQNKYGLPLDNRSQYTKLDWTVWTATLAESRQDFETFLNPVLRFAQESPSRVPLTDWYWTQDAKQRGFQARSVVGGVYIKMLSDQAMWKKWASRASAGGK
jgi:hypothetical protein